ncbi:MAG: AraC family transcriptional regulator ligand-binding domain-containing protein [Myxococcota bacterium]
MSPIAGAVAFAVSQGLPLERVTEVTGVTLTELVQPGVRISDEVVSSLWELIDDVFAGRAMGLEMAKTAPLSFFGVVGHVAGHATCLQAALDAMVRYRSVFSQELQLDVQPGPEETTLLMSHALDFVRYSSTPPEAAMGLSVRFLREVLMHGDAIVRVEFVHEPVAPLEVYAEFFGVEVRFGQPANALIFQTATLEHPNDRSDRFRYQVGEQQLERLRDQLGASEASVELARVRSAITVNARGGEYGAEALAKRLGMSLRSLERQARAHGTTVRRLVEDARESHARQLLEDRRLGVAEVAFMLGYSAESAFRRAFKRWSGMSPAEFRRARPSPVSYESISVAVG